MKCLTIRNALAFINHVSSFAALSVLFYYSEELIQGHNKEFWTHLKRMTLIPDYFGGRAMLERPAKVI